MSMDTRPSLSESPVIIADREAWEQINLKDAGTIEVEIGFGSGEYLLRRASEYPDRLFIGIEKKSGLITDVAKKVAIHNLDNIRLLDSCARNAFTCLFPACSISRAYSLFPDPWQKKKTYQAQTLFDAIPVPAQQPAYFRRRSAHRDRQQRLLQLGAEAAPRHRLRGRKQHHTAAIRH